MKDAEDVFAAYVAGAEEKHCTTDKDGVECTIGGLLPRIPFKVCVRICHPKPATRTSASFPSTDGRIVSSSDLFEVAAVDEREKYICSNAVCGSVTLPMQGEKC